MRLFRDDIEVFDDVYRELRDVPSLTDKRSELESLWHQFTTYADRDFLKEIARQFHPRFWEMYLTCSLLDLGFDIAPHRGDGPDIEIRQGSDRIWIEAVAPGPGTGADKVALNWTTDECIRVPEEQIVLRFQSAIAEKLEKAKKYASSKRTTPYEPFVIAINGYQVPLARVDDEIPYAIQAVLPIGLRQAVVDVESGEPVHFGYEDRRYVEKRSGASVPTTSFFDPDYSIISGILYSNVDAFSVLEAGCDFVFLHNPFADNTLPQGWISKGCEYWLDGSNLRKRRLEFLERPSHCPQRVGREADH